MDYLRAGTRSTTVAAVAEDMRQKRLSVSPTEESLPEAVTSPSDEAMQLPPTPEPATRVYNATYGRAH